MLPIEMERKVGPNKENRRLVSKYLSDMGFMCNYLCLLIAEKKGEMEEVISLKLVNCMFAAVTDLLPGQRDAQKQWATVLRQVRRINARKKLIGTAKRNIKKINYLNNCYQDHQHHHQHDHQHHQ
jgi:hypothetical protein